MSDFMTTHAASFFAGNYRKVIVRFLLIDDTSTDVQGVKDTKIRELGSQVTNVEEHSE